MSAIAPDKPTIGAGYDEPLALAINRHWRGKPAKTDHGRWDTSWERAILTPSQIMALATEDGHAFTCSLKKAGGRNSETFDALNLIGLDFDTTGIDAILLHPLAPYASFAYESSSSTAQSPRSRLIFVTAEALDFAAAKIAIAAMQHAFAELGPDVSTKDPTRCWYGSVGKRSEWIGGLLDAETLETIIDALPETAKPVTVAPVDLTGYSPEGDVPDPRIFGLTAEQIDYLYHPNTGDGNYRHNRELGIANALVSGGITDEEFYRLWKRTPIGTAGRASDPGQGDRYIARTLAAARGDAPHRSNEAAITNKSARQAAHDMADAFNGNATPADAHIFSHVNGNGATPLLSANGAVPMADPTKQGATVGAARTNGAAPNKLLNRLQGVVLPKGNGYRRMTFEQFLVVLKGRADREYDESEILGYAMNGQRGDAELLNQCAGDLVCYFHPDKLFYWFDGVSCHDVSENSVIHLASELIQPLYGRLAKALFAQSVDAAQKGDDKESDRLAKQADTVSKRSAALKASATVQKVLVFAKSDMLMGRSDAAAKWDSNIELLGVQNGVVSLLTGRMVEPDPTQMIRTCAPVDFDPGAKADLFRKCLTEIFADDAEKPGYAQRQIGYAVSGTALLALLFTWIGKGGQNGKELIMGVIKCALGDKLAGILESEVLLASRHARAANSSTEAVMTLRGRRIAWVSETNEGREMDLAKMKELTGNHVLTGRHNHGSQQEWRRTHTPFLLTNHKPHVRSQGNAEWSRIRVLEFKYSFVTNPDPTKPEQRKADPTLEARINANEASGVLNWIIEGCLEWRKNGLREPDSVKKATEAYKNAEDTLGLFIEECCAVGDGKRAARALMFTTYKGWMDDRGKPMSKGTFFDKMQDRGFEIKTIDGIVSFKGVEIL